MLKHQVCKIIGYDLFNECYAFFENVLRCESQYKIILTRRCFSLFKIFASILEADGITNEFGVIITDNALPANLQNIRAALKKPSVEGAASVVIVDDILIYGRTINTILNNIFEKGVNDIDKNNIRVLCFVQNEHNYLNSEYANLVLPCNTVSSIDWKEYSRIFSKLIKASDIANTSYIVSSTLPLDASSKASVDFCKENMCCTTTDELGKNHVESYVIAAAMPDSTKDLFSLPNIPCSFIRVYIYQEYKKIMLSPLLILNDLSPDKMRTVLHATVDRLGKQAPNFSSLLLDENTDLCSYRMRMLTLLLSHIMLRDFMKQYGLSYNICDTDYIEIVKYNFSDSLLDDFIKVDSDISSLAEDLFSYTAEGIDSDYKDLADFVFRKAMMDNHSVANDSSKRQDGFSSMEKQPLFTQKHIAGLMTLVDNGVATLRAAISSGSDVFVTNMHPGEQAFRVMSDRCQKLLPAMYTLENIAEIHNQNSYDLLSEFSEFVKSQQLQTEEENKEFLFYFDILAGNNQHISDVMCVNYTDRILEDSIRITALLDKFLATKVKKDLTIIESANTESHPVEQFTSTASNVAACIANAYYTEFHSKIDEIRLHTLLYLVQREALADVDKVAFVDEFRAWKSGPLVLCVRDAYKNGTFPDVRDIKLSGSLKEVIDRVLDDYKDYSLGSLYNLIHGQLSWRNARIGIPDVEISNNLMKLTDIKRDAERLRYTRTSAMLRGIADANK